MSQLERPNLRVCPQCPEPFDDHIVMPTSADPLDGGIILCPHKGCECVTMWSPAGRDVARIPSDAEVATLRRELQEVLGR